jgi:hypothetical protein
VRKRFGISILTFYRWRGAVRPKAQSGERASRIADGGLRTQARAATQARIPVHCPGGTRSVLEAKPSLAGMSMPLPSSWRPGARRTLYVTLSALLHGLSTGSDLAVGYTGGPAVVDVLGWDPVAKRIYFYGCSPGETGAFGDVSYFDLASRDPERLKRVSWNQPEATSNDRDQTRLFKALRNRLKPLIPIMHPALAKALTVTKIDSVVTPLGNRARYHLEVTYEIGLNFEVEAYSKDFAVRDMFRVPGRREWLYVVTFRGNPYDGLLAETQVPVLVVGSQEGRARRLSWGTAKVIAPNKEAGRSR